jgi:hypothetical protein
MKFMEKSRGHRTATMASILIALGCVTKPPAGETCETAQCRQERVLQAWPRDQAEAMALWAQLPDQGEKNAAVSKLIDIYPGTVGSLCFGLPDGPTKARCQAASSRPHLRMQKAGIKERNDANPSLPRDGRYSLKRASSLADVTPDQVTCESHEDRNSCLLDASIQRARQGDAAGAAAMCTSVTISGHSATLWRSECFFQAAEHRFDVDHVSGYPDAVELCSASGSYHALCQMHLVSLMSESVQGADVGDPASWAEVARGADAVAAVWADSPSKSSLVDGVWALALLRSMARTTVVSGDVLDLVPAFAVPHLRTAAANRMLNLSDPAAHDLQGWVDTIEAALQQRVGNAPRETPFQKIEIVPEIWPREEALLAKLPTIPYRGPARRVLAEDAHADMAICVLEAAARLDPVATALLKEGTTHQDPSVQWTARQLMKRVGQSGHP